MSAQAIEPRILGDEQCCELSCNGGACEGCPCCSAGWCVFGHDGLPEDPEDFTTWLRVAAEHNPVAARMRAEWFAPHELLLLKRAARLKLADCRQRMNKARRKGDRNQAARFARARGDYAELVLRLDVLVTDPEEQS